jgi:copper transport protein
VRIRFLVLAFVALLLAIGPATPAFAHASLSSTNPASGSTLATPPASTTLSFTEAVQIPVGSIQVFNERSEFVPLGGKAVHPGGNSTEVEIPLGTLANGGYVVVWRVISADGHPITGAYTFQVGEGDIDTNALSQRMADKADGSAAVRYSYTVDRGLLFASLMVMLGALGFLVFFGLDDVTVRRSRLLFYGASGLLLLSTIASFLLQGLYGAGLPFSRTFDADVLNGTLDSRYGESVVVRVVALIALVTLVAVFGTRRRLGRVLSIIGSLVVIASVSTSGHATTGRWIPFALVADVVHLAATGLWIGGLVVLVFVAMRQQEKGVSLVRWFSGLAFWCVVVLVITGTFQGIRQLHDVTALWESRYGVTLMIKVGVFLLLLAAAAASRAWVGRTSSESTFVRRSMGVEIVFAVVVIAVTSFLVTTPPVKADVRNKPISVEVRVQDSLVDLVIDPAKVGENAVHLYVLNQQGVAKDVPEVQMSVSQTDKGIGPIRLDLQKIRAGYYAVPDFVFPVDGKWRAGISVRTTDVDQFTSTIDLNIG